jgi:hypothetical protein
VTDNTGLPEWVIASQDRLEKLTPKIQKIKQEGQDEARRGLEKVEIANEIEVEIDYLGRVLTQPHEPELWNDEIVAVSGVRLADRIEALDGEVDQLLGISVEGAKLEKDAHLRFVFSHGDTGTTAGTALYLGAGIERRLLALEPAYTPVMGNHYPPRLGMRDELLRELKDLVTELGAEFVQMLDGSEAALSSSTADALSQAAHSMRDCFQQILERLAPSKVVEAQPWFKATEGAPGGISRRARIRYVLYGSGEGSDEDVIQKLDQLADIAKDTLDICIARAHEHDPSLTVDEVRLAIDQGRHALRRVLILYKE